MAEVLERYIFGNPVYRDMAGWSRFFSKLSIASSILFGCFQKPAHKSPTFSIRLRIDFMFHVSGVSFEFNSRGESGVETGAWGKARTE